MNMTMKIEDAFEPRSGVTLVSGVVPQSFATNNLEASKNVGPQVSVSTAAGDCEFQVVDVATSISLTGNRNLTIGLATKEKFIDLVGGTVRLS